jgi:7,8-dihydroneopterin aldolase/epimerase/oxygenase
MGEASKSRVIEPLRIADALEHVRHVFVRDLVLPCDIGVHPHEKGRPQRVRVNLDLAVTDDGTALADRLENVVCYEDVVTRIRAITADGHINLVETLAERIAQTCLQHPACHTARVRVEKLDVFEDVESVGVEIERKSST